jgi:NAD(P)-dependent dehydrogenase (short-subunit alcohol dehydrogenase family)
MGTERLAGRIAVVFGAGSVGPGWGNGKAAAVQYARSGATVAVADISAAAAEETAAIIAGEQGRARAFRCDVTRQDDIDSVVTAMEREHGRVDILHNNVGAPDMGSIEELSPEDWTRTQDIILKSVFLTC